MRYEIWMEGYRATGEAGYAHRVATIEAPNFRAACSQWAKGTENPLLYDAEKLTYWGCGLFDNEKRAREVFG